MRYKPSLRARFVAALLLGVTLISGGFIYAVYELVELLEVDLMEGTVKRDLGELARRFSAAPDVQPPTAMDLKSYILRPGEAPPSEFPAWLLSWPASRYDSFESGDKEFFVGREDVGDARLYLVLDIENIERLETRLTELAL